MHNITHNFRLELRGTTHSILDITFMPGKPDLLFRISYLATQFVCGWAVIIRYSLLEKGIYVQQIYCATAFKSGCVMLGR